MATTNEPACDHSPTTADGRPVVCHRCKDLGATEVSIPEWAKRQATMVLRSRDYAFLSAWERHPVDQVARALAVAYARGREDAAMWLDTHGYAVEAAAIRAGGA